MGVPIQGTGGIFPTMVHTSVNPLKSEFLIYLHGGIYRIIHHGDYAIYTTMVVYEKYTPQGVSQEVCPGHVTRLRLHDGILGKLFALQLAAPSCRAKMPRSG